MLEDETNRNILARHVGIDAFSCFGVVYLGWYCCDVAWSMLAATWWPSKRGTGESSVNHAVPVAYENRIYAYDPAAHRLILFFFSYQLKNTYDTIVWNDGIEFIIHHALCLLIAYPALSLPCLQAYGPFYFGISELSTGVLCLLANFDDVHGVKGLADAFPLPKVILGVSFAVLFVTCRVLMWCTISYYFIRDVRNALNGTGPRLEQCRIYLQFSLVSLSILSLLQVLWLGQIFIQGKEEMEKLGYL